MPPPRAIPIVLTAVLIDTIGFGIVLPVLPALLGHIGHVRLADATRISGYLIAVFALTQFFAGPVLGNLSDRFGRRPVLIASMLAFAIDYALMALAPTIAWLFVGRAIAGITGAVYAPANAVLADVTAPEQRGRVYGWMGAAFGFGFIIGPAIGGLLAGFGVRAPFVGAAILALVNALAMITLMPETLARENRRAFRWQSANIFSAFAPLMRSGGATALLLALFLWQLAHNVYPATWSFWAVARFGWSEAEIGLSLAFVGLVMAVVQGLLTGPIIARVGEWRAIVVGLGAGALAFAGYAFVSASWQAYALFLVGAISGLVAPSMNALLTRMTDATNQGALQGGIGSMASVATIVAPLLMTQALASGVAAGFPGAAFVLAAILASLSLLLILAAVARRGRMATAG